jgi:hypothetical protein
MSTTARELNKKKKLFNPSGLTTKERKFAIELLEYLKNVDTEGETNVLNPAGTGLYGAGTIPSDIRYNKSADEKVIQHAGAYITFGYDKPSGPESGNGRAGATRSSRIDLVVGRMSGRSKPPAGSIVNNSFETDAARIYISSLTDIDTNFGIDPGKTGERLKDRSGIGIKADGVRIIGREGVKIVTGASTGGRERNSLDGKTLPSPYIELIAGNSSEKMGFLTDIGEITNGRDYLGQEYDPLQGVAMGLNTSQAIIELTDIINDILSLHRKNLTRKMLLRAKNSIIFTLPPALWSAATAALNALEAVKDSKDIVNAYEIAIKTALVRVNYCTPIGYKRIESRYVKST